MVISDTKTEAIAVLQALMQSQTETVRLAAASTILQFAHLLTETANPDTHQSPTSNSSVPPLIQAHRFELIGDNGEVLAILGRVEQHPFDGELGGDITGLAFLDKEGHPQVRLCGDNHDGTLTTSGLTMYGLTGQYRVNVGASDGGAGIDMKHGDGAYLEQFVASNTPILRFTDKDGKMRLFLALDTFQLLAADGSIVFKTPAVP